VIAFFVVYPTLLTVDYLAKPRAPIDEAALGLRHEAVTLPASDGVRVSGWYVPPRNGAAIVLVHGGGGDRQARSGMRACWLTPATASCCTTRAAAARAPGTKVLFADGPQGRTASDRALL